MAEMVRYKNIGHRTETIYVDDEPVVVIPGATVLVPADHYASAVRAFRRVAPGETVPTTESTPAELAAEVERLRRQLAQAEEASAQADDSEDEDPGEDDEVTQDGGSYPRYNPGGKWELSDGSFTKGGTNREAAEAAEAALHQDQE